MIRSAILHQIKSEQWQDLKFIANPSTWLNQSRWLDDPKEMKVYNRTNGKPSNTVGSRQHGDLPDEGYYKN